MQIVNYRRWLHALMWVAIAFGAYSRLKGLGTWPLAEDEYFTVQSVYNILRHGLPQFACGGYYMRELTLQYLIAPLYALGLSAELGGRLVTVACSFAVLPGVYLLGKRLSGTTVACLGVILLSLSLWEIEFARFARMYMPFQAVFVWYVLTMHRVVVDRDESAYKWLWLLSVVGVFTWAGGIFLLVTNFVPNLIASTPSRAKHWAVNTGLLGAGYWFRTLNFRFTEAQPAFPPDVPVDIHGSGFVLPPLLGSTLSAHPGWAIGALVVVAAGLFAVFQLVRASGWVRERLVWIALVVFALANLFGCALIALVLALLIGWIDIRRFSRRNAIVAVASIAVSFVFWLSYTLLTDSARELFPGFGPGGELSKLAVVLFKYPNVFDPILFPWLAAVPRLTTALVGLVGLGLAWAVFGKDGDRLPSLRLTLAVCLIMAALVGVIETKYLRTRYSFFLLPVLYLIALAAIDALFVRPLRHEKKRGLVFALALVALLGFTEDFGWAHLMRMDSAAWNYRLPLNAARSNHYYPRRDYRTPAEYVNRRARPNDLVIAASQVVPFYLERTNFMYWSAHWGEFASFSCDRGRRERWSESRLLYRKKDLFDAIDAASGDIWVVAMIGFDFSTADTPEPRYPATLAYRGRAGLIGVYKIDTSPSRSTALR